MTRFLQAAGAQTLVDEALAVARDAEKRIAELEAEKARIPFITIQDMLAKHPELVAKMEELERAEFAEDPLLHSDGSGHH